MRALFGAAILVLLVGVASAAVLVTLNTPGTVRIVNATLTISPSTINWGNVTSTSTQGGNSTVTITLTNTGQLNLALSFICNQCPSGANIVLGSKLNGFPSSLVAGASWTGPATFVAGPGITAGVYNPVLVIDGSA